MFLIDCKRAAFRMIRVGALVSLTLIASSTTLRAQGSGLPSTTVDSAANADDTSLVMDVRARVMAFTNALDSVYTTIAGTYYGIEPILRQSCYDCHSGQTRYPWYYKIPGIRGMIDADIEDGRKQLDMDEGFPFGGRASQEEHLLEMRQEIASGGMPLRSYRWMHWGAGLNDTERDSVFTWIDSSVASIHVVMKAFGVEPPDDSAPIVYICPMCPEVVSARPGTCPKCGMDLEELTREPATP